MMSGEGRRDDVRGGRYERDVVSRGALRRGWLGPDSAVPALGAANPSRRLTGLGPVSVFGLLLC